MQERAATGTTRRGVVARRTALYAFASVLSLILCGALPACSASECGAGTIQVGARCMPATTGQDVTNCECGSGTHFDRLTSACVLDSPETLCGDGTTPIVVEDGTTTCIGGGSGPTCDPWCMPPAVARSETTP